MEGELLQRTQYPEGWKKTYCVVHNNFLKCYFSERDHKSGVDPVELIDLNRCNLSTDEDDTASLFKIKMFQSEKVWTLKPSGSTKRLSWVEAIRRYSNGNREERAVRYRFQCPNTHVAVPHPEDDEHFLAEPHGLQQPHVPAHYPLFQRRVQQSSHKAPQLDCTENVQVRASSTSLVIVYYF